MFEPSQLLQTLASYWVDPSRRLFWGFILSSVVIIVLQWLWQKKRFTWKRIKLTFFSKKYWLNKSSLTDVGWLSLNAVIRAALLVPLFGSHLLGAMWVAKQLQSNFDRPPELHFPWWAIALTYTLVYFVIEDFSRFYLHRLMHKVPTLWRFHRVHHSAEILTPLTLYRIHPIEMTLYYVRGMVVFSVVSGVFIYFAGKKLNAIDILGVDALGFLFNFLGANLRHSHIWLGFGVFERWFISPAQHQIHHSKSELHRDKNFGTCLACWDRWFGALVYSGKRKKITFGIAQKQKLNTFSEKTAFRGPILDEVHMK